MFGTTDDSVPWWIGDTLYETFWVLSVLENVMGFNVRVAETFRIAAGHVYPVKHTSDSRPFVMIRARGLNFEQPASVCLLPVLVDSKFVENMFLEVSL